MFRDSFEPNSIIHLGTAQARPAPGQPFGSSPTARTNIGFQLSLPLRCGVCEARSKAEKSSPSGCYRLFAPGSWLVAPADATLSACFDCAASSQPDSILTTDSPAHTLHPAIRAPNGGIVWADVGRVGAVHHFCIRKVQGHENCK